MNKGLLEVLYETRANLLNEYCAKCITAEGECTTTYEDCEYCSFHERIEEIEEEIAHEEKFLDI